MREGGEEEKERKRRGGRREKADKKKGRIERRDWRRLLLTCLLFMLRKTMRCDKPESLPITSFLMLRYAKQAIIRNVYGPNLENSLHFRAKYLLK